MVVFGNDEAKARMLECATLAKELGCAKSLDDTLEYLNTYANRPGCRYEKEGTRCKLFDDFAPHSFLFYMEHGDGQGGWKHWFTGGLIYHGPTSPGDGSFPALSVSLNKSTEPRWEVHT